MIESKEKKLDDLAIIEATALQLLALREHTQRELRRKLVQRGHDAVAITAVLEKLANEGWQSDIRFVELYIAERANKGFGPLRIEQELQQRGITSVIIAARLAECEVDWLQQLKKAHLKKFKNSFPGDFKEKAKQIRFLQYRGFDLELIQSYLT